MSLVADTRRHRSLWLTVPLYVLILAIIALDLWAVGVWAAVGASLGNGLALLSAAVGMVLGEFNVSLGPICRRQRTRPVPTVYATTSPVSAGPGLRLQGGAFRYAW